MSTALAARGPRPGVAPPRIALSDRARRGLTAVANHAVAIVLAVIFLFPFAVVVLTSLMTQRQAGTSDLLPHHVVWSNFAKVFEDTAFGRDLWNTVLYAGLTTVGCVASSIPVAYVLSRVQWRGRNVAFMIVLATMMIPDQITSIPLYVMYSKFGWVGSLKPLIVPSFFGDAFGIFLLRQFFLTIPREMNEAAKVDGANEWRAMVQVIMPMAKPAIAAVGLLQFLFAWNDFYNPLLYTGNSSHSQTLAVAVSQIGTGGHISAYQLEMAASLMFLLPVVILFFFAQRVFTEGVSISGTKE